MAHEYTNLVQRLNGEYRIPIHDGLGPVGGEEPDNPNEFVRTFESPPIQKEAALVIDSLVSQRDDAIDRYHQNDGLEGAVSANIRDLLNSQNVPLAAFIDDHVANAIVQRNVLHDVVRSVEDLVRNAPVYDGKSPESLTTFLTFYTNEWLPSLKKVLEKKSAVV